MLCSNTGKMKNCASCSSLRLIEGLLGKCVNADGTNAVSHGIDYGNAEEKLLDLAVGWAARN